MLSDEEKKAIEYWRYIRDTQIYDGYKGQVYAVALVNLIEKQSKEIEELKADRKSYAEEYIHNNPWLYKQLNENYILRVESEQKERKAYIKGTNDADELCNKKWKGKIKAKIEEVDKMKSNGKYTILFNSDNVMEVVKAVLQSLLEKE